MAHDIEGDLQDVIMDAVSTAETAKTPIGYSRGPLSDLYLKREFARMKLSGVHQSVICRVVTRLLTEGVFVLRFTNDCRLAYLGDREEAYPIYRLLLAP